MPGERAPPPYPLFATRAMRRFRCIADRCEDSCCTGHRILLTPEEASRLRRTLEPSEWGQEALKTRVARTNGDEDHPVQLAVRDGRCAFLEPSGLCSALCRGHPVTGLPNACIDYPRRFGAVAHKGVEVHGTVGCPEMARLTLLSEDGLELEPAGPEVADRYPELRVQFKPAPYDEPLEAVRAFGVARLRDGSLPLSLRLFALADLGRRVDGFFHRGAWNVDAQRLARELEDAATPRTTQALSGLLEPEAPPPLVDAVLLTLRSRLGRRARRYDEVVGPALERAAPDAAATYLQRARGADPRVQVWLARYLESEWIQDWYVSRQTLSARALELLWQACLARFLLAALPPGDGLEQGAVALIQVLQKYVARDGERSSPLPAQLEALGPEPFDRALAMARFLA